MDDFVLHPMVQGHEDRGNQNHHAQVFPGFPLCYAEYTLLKYQENKFKEHQEGKKANEAYGGS